MLLFCRILRRLDFLCFFIRHFFHFSISLADVTLIRSEISLTFLCHLRDCFRLIRTIALMRVCPPMAIRTVFLDETKADYVRTAFAKGLGSGRVLFKHILKNAMIPILTNMVIGIPFLILGAFLLERFFSIPGLGDILINAINTGDFPIIKGLSVLIAIAYSFFNLLTDVLYAFVDPRVQLS